MLRTAASCLLLATLSSCLYQSPFCQSWCYGQRNVVQPQVCNTRCGGYATACCTGQTGYPVIYPGASAGWSGIQYPNPGAASVGWPAVQNPNPGASVSWPGIQSNPGVPTVNWPGIQYPIVIVDPSQLPKTNKEDLKVVVQPNPSGHREWICPPDPQPRVGTISGTLSTSPVLQACERDENCSSFPQHSKCCFDNGVAMTVCKPAMLA